MPEFLYFVETGGGRSGLRPGECPELGRVMPRGAACLAVGAESSPSPRGAAGLLCVDSASAIGPERLRIRGNKDGPRIRWEEWGEGSIGTQRVKIVVGMWEDWRPGERDLMRARVREGYRVELGNGEEWLVPVLKYATGRSGLPEELRVTSEGKLERKPRVEYAGLCARAERYWEALLAIAGGARAESVILSDAEGYLLACEALGLNYRVTRAEVNLLGLLNDVADRQTLGQAVYAAVDGPGLEAFASALKKNDEGAE